MPDPSTIHSETRNAAFAFGESDAASIIAKKCRTETAFVRDTLRFFVQQSAATAKAQAAFDALLARSFS